MSLPVKALLFDFGGVLINVHFERVFEIYAQRSGVPIDQIKASFAFDEAFAQQERNDISITDYFAHLRKLCGVDLSDSDFLEGWNALLGEEIAGAEAILEREKRSAPLYLFTNTNPTHFAEIKRRYPNLLRHFTKIFASCDMKMRKPEAQAFTAVAKDIGVRLEEILFFDDLDKNIEGAEAIGMQAVLVTSLAHITNALSAPCAPDTTGAIASQD